MEQIGTTSTSAEMPAFHAKPTEERQDATTAGRREGR